MKHLFTFAIGLLLAAFAVGCEESVEHTAPAILERDSASMMTTWGVNTLISDSGVMRYRIVTEKWEVNTVRNPSRWIFEKGLFLEQFDQTFHVEAYIQCDTAYYYDQQRLWHLKSRVRVRTKDGLRFSSEELYWDQMRHEMYSNKFSHLVTPQREMQGSYFRSDENMTRYQVSNSKCSFVKSDMQSEGDSIISAPDSVKAAKRPQTTSKRKTIKTTL